MKIIDPNPIFIDFEASSVTGYPVQVAYGTCEEDIKCFLIKPLPVWDRADYLWDYNAEDIHGFSKEYLKKHGLEAAVVAREVSEDLKGKTIYANYPMDMGWLLMLLDDVAEVTNETYPEPKFMLMQKLINESKIDPYYTVKGKMIANERFRKSGLRLHKADNDVLKHIWTWKAMVELEEAIK